MNVKSNSKTMYYHGSSDFKKYTQTEKLLYYKDVLSNPTLYKNVNFAFAKKRYNDLKSKCREVRWLPDSVTFGGNSNNSHPIVVLEKNKNNEYAVAKMQTLRDNKQLYNGNFQFLKTVYLHDSLLNGEVLINKKNKKPIYESDFVPGDKIFVFPDDNKLIDNHLFNNHRSVNFYKMSMQNIEKMKKFRK